MPTINERPHKRLFLWQRAVDLVVLIYEVTKSFPRQEEYGLTAQLRRAAVSIPSNIAEGLSRKSIAEKLHFLNIAQASLSEVDTQVEISLRLHYLGESWFTRVEEELVKVQKLLGGLIRNIRS